MLSYRSFRLVAVLVLFILLAAPLHGQSVTISPSYPGVKVGASVQLTAKVTGLSSSSVNWAVNGIAGGNTTVGTISQTGLYTAPAAVPPQALVTATSTVNTSLKEIGRASCRERV